MDLECYRRRSGSKTTVARQHIEEIRKNKFCIGKKERNPLTQDLHHAVVSLSAELYTKDVHFLMELIQINAEDNEYQPGVEPTLEFLLTNKDITNSGAPATLLVLNNEVGFTRENMNSICSIGMSTKKGKKSPGYIGEKGIPNNMGLDPLMSRFSGLGVGAGAGAGGMTLPSISNVPQKNFMPLNLYNFMKWVFF